MSHKKAKQERKAVNEFSKQGFIKLPGALPQVGDKTFDITVRVRQSDGAIVGIIGPKDMPPAVTIDILATAIKGMALGIIQGDQQEPSLIVVPTLAGVKPL